jgi:hypothetical protein
MDTGPEEDDFHVGREIGRGRPWQVVNTTKHLFVFDATVK